MREGPVPCNSHRSFLGRREAAEAALLATVAAGAPLNVNQRPVAAADGVHVLKACLVGGRLQLEPLCRGFRPWKSHLLICRRVYYT